MKKQIILGMLSLCLLLSGCAKDASQPGSSPDPALQVPHQQAEDLLEQITPNRDAAQELTGADAVLLTDFSLELLRQSEYEDNALLSPVSALCALGMTANGARQDTLSQMEAAFGMDRDTLNRCLLAYQETLPDEPGCAISLANSLWLNADENLQVQEPFLQACADHYTAAIYERSFDDQACAAINDWVSDNTGGRIDQMLDNIAPEAMLYLINAVAFDAKWSTIYREDQVHEGIFTTADGVEQSVELMYAEEGMYLEDAFAAGFLKHYENDRYAFCALLPAKGVSLEEYIQSLSGEGLVTMIQNAQDIPVITAIPKFENRDDMDLKQMLQVMGVEDAFDAAKADFTAMAAYEDGAQNIYISQVLHKTSISVNEQGTQAGAATAVEMTAASDSPAEEKTVILDRPFVYLLVDCETGVPVFVGTMTGVE